MAQLNITILGQQYKIGCPDGEQDSLQKTVAQVDDHLKELKTSGRNLRNEQLIVMAALNYRHQLNTLQTQEQTNIQQLNAKIEKLEAMLSTVLDKTNVTPRQDPNA